MNFRCFPFKYKNERLKHWQNSFIKIGDQQSFMFFKDTFFVDSRFTSFSFFSESFLLHLLLNKKDWLFGLTLSTAVLLKNKVSVNRLVFFVYLRVVQQKESIIHWHVICCFVVSRKPPMWYSLWWFLIWQIQQQAKLL